MTLVITRADLEAPELAEFLSAHLADMALHSPEESCHALDLEGLRKPGLRLWTGHLDGRLVATAALGDLGDGHAELKTMRTDPAVRGRGLAAQMLTHVLDDARSRGITRIWLETGAPDHFIPARTLYATRGFVECEPFADYVLDPYSVFMTRSL